jgi:large conductance mechanosensitive channel protein
LGVVELNFYDHQDEVRLEVGRIEGVMTRSVGEGVDRRIEILPGDAGYKDWALKIGEKTIPYGAFLGDIVSFLLLAAALFVFIVKFLGWLMKSKAAEVAAPPGPTKEQELLTEIRDLLKERR